MHFVRMTTGKNISCRKMTSVNTENERRNILDKDLLSVIISFKLAKWQTFKWHLYWMHEEINMLITTHADKRWPGSGSEYSPGTVLCSTRTEWFSTGKDRQEDHKYESRDRKRNRKLLANLYWKAKWREGRCFFRKRLRRYSIFMNCTVFYIVSKLFLGGPKFWSEVIQHLCIYHWSPT